MQMHEYVTYDFLDVAISKVIYTEKQSKWLNYLPSHISKANDIHKITFSERDKIKESAKLYKSIKNTILFGLDDILADASKDFDKYFDKSIKLLTDKKVNKFIQDTIKDLKHVSGNVRKFVIEYDKLSWFRDPNLIATICFHEKLNDAFLSKAFDSLESNQYTYLDLEQLKNEVGKIISDASYIKSIIVILFQPLLTYGAIYASLNHDYEYIFKYNKVVSEAAECLFYLNPSMKHIFFEQKIK